MVDERKQKVKLTNVSFELASVYQRGKMTIWVNEQIDPSGMIHACIACCDETQAQACHESYEQNLTETQKAAGWEARLRTVKSWDEVPVNALKLD